MKLFLILLLCLGCFADDTFAQQKAFVPRKIVFEKTSLIDSLGDKSAAALVDSLGINLGQDSDLDSNENILGGMMKEMFNEFFNHQKTEVVQIFIESLQDTLWRHRKINGEMIGDYERLNENGTIHVHSKFAKHLVENVYNGLDTIKEKLTVYKKDRKNISGFDCFKVVLLKPTDKNSELGIDFGDGVLEMYVTDLIAVPVFSIIRVSRNYPFFPLEIKASSKNFPGIWEVYKVITIER